MEIKERNYLNEPIIWRKKLDVEFPYEAVHDGKILTLKVNDFPEEHLYSLLLDKDEIATFNDWPSNWIRPEREDKHRRDLNDIIGRSGKMQALYQMIETVAQVQSTVLVTGESGTGKELVARAIHDLVTRELRSHSSRSIVELSLRRCSNPNCLVMSKAHSPARTLIVKVCLKPPTRALSFWMKSAKCLQRCR